jgi:hypothetical protein
MAKPLGTSIEDDLKLLDAKVKQAKFEYDQYFLGHRPREPAMTRQEAEKIIAYWSNLPIQNTGYRFKFNTLIARFFALKRQWENVLRKIEEGTYERHLFKVKLRDRDRGGEATAEVPAPPIPAAPAAGGDLFAAYCEARRSCGQSVQGLTPEKLDAILGKQAESIRSQFGVREVRFKVVVEGGQAKLKATPVKSA